MSMTSRIKIALASVGLLLVGLLLSQGSAYSQGSLTGQQILEKIDARGGSGGSGSRISFSAFAIVDRSGTQQTKNFVFFGKSSGDVQTPNRTLIYFLEPPQEECGTIFLSIDKKITGQKADLYLFLPALGQVKQLISTSERKGSFAGSNLTFDQIGRSELHTDFNAERLNDETLRVTVNGQPQDRTVFVLQLAANPQTNPGESFPKRKIWVDQEQFIVLKSEDTNTVDKLQSATTIDNLVSDPEPSDPNRLAPNTISVKNVLDNSSTTVNITARENIGDLPESIFDPNNLPQFDPRQFNDKLQHKVPDPTCP